MVKGLRLHGGLCAAPGMTLPPGVCPPSFTAAPTPQLWGRGFHSSEATG